MKIAVLIKRVPDTAASIRVAGEGKAIAQDVEWILSPYDEMAVEEALRIKEKLGGNAEVIAITLCAKDAQSHIRLALEMGADRAIQLVEGSGERDALGTARLLADALKAENPVLILAGRAAVDLDQSYVPSAVAAILNIAALSGATKLDIANGKAIARREVEGGYEVISAVLPCVVTAQKGLNEPRYPSLKSKMAAKKKTIEQRPVADSVPKTQLVGYAYPPQRKAGRIVGQGVEAVPALVKILREDIKLF